MSKGKAYVLSVNAFEAYRRGEISLSQAAEILRRQRGLFPWGCGDVWFYLGWIVHRAIFCVLGLHLWVKDDAIFVPFYGWGARQCEVCGLIKVKP